MQIDAKLLFCMSKNEIHTPNTSRTAKGAGGCFVEEIACSSSCLCEFENWLCHTQWDDYGVRILWEDI
jgi:hypothetical protein